MNAGFTVAISFSMSPKSPGVRDERDRVVVDEREALHAGVGVRVKERERKHDRIAPLVHRAPEPCAELEARDDHAVMRADDAFGRTRRSAAHQDHRRIVRVDMTRRTPGGVMALESVGESFVTVTERDLLALFLLLEQLVARAQRRRQILLDAGGDEPVERRLGLNAFQLVVVRLSTRTVSAPLADRASWSSRSV
jgi:hypothetical protein